MKKWECEKNIHEENMPERLCFFSTCKIKTYFSTKASVFFKKNLEEGESITL